MKGEGNNSKERDLVIMGVDPGSNVMGFALIKADSKKKLSVLCMDHLDLRKIEDRSKRLKQIFLVIERLLESYQPQEVAFEAPFFGKNVQSMLKLGRAQGMAMAPVIMRELPLFEYSPKKIKLSITGSGNASKEQVAGMLYHQLDLSIPPEQLDASDALATALCHYHQRNSLGGQGKSYKNWGAYIADNPDKIA